MLVPKFAKPTKNVFLFALHWFAVLFIVLLLYIIHSFHHFYRHTVTVRGNAQSRTKHAQLLTEKDSPCTNGVFRSNTSRAHHQSVLERCRGRRQRLAGDVAGFLVVLIRGISRDFVTYAAIWWRVMIE